MRLVFDIHHPADINFFKNAINELLSRNFEVIITALPRGPLVEILKNELPNLDILVVGKESKKGLLNKVNYTVKRIIELYNVLKKIDFNLSLGFGGEGISHASFLLGKPSLVFEDDPEYTLSYLSYKFFATRILMNNSISITGRKIQKYNGFKEIAYLHPDYFIPSTKVLSQYQVEPFKYIFVREVDNVSLNYNHLEDAQLYRTCQKLKAQGYKIILSLENKSLMHKYIDSCLVLKEPVTDFYSLLYYASACISSGDTVAREACLLGTPCLYTGGRVMAANQPLIELGIFNECQESLSEKAVEIANKLYDWKSVMRSFIVNHCDDTTAIIVKNVEGMLNILGCDKV